ncbi:MAG: amidohydrolase [Bacteroidetes bacterium]|nr:amidohydrolase [Bacteroidota bacterium]NBX64506.1 amidohydrolase [Bacteroidota bacterium]
MKRFFLIFLIVFFSQFTLSAQNQSNRAIYTAEKIYLADTGFTTATAMVVENSIILYAGDVRTADSLYPNTPKMEFPGKFIYPGFIDAHCHFLAYSKGLTEVDLVGCKSEADAVKRAKKFSKKNTLPWLIGRGWDQNDWASKSYPSMAQLDKAFPNTPVCLSRIDGHAVWINSAAVKALNLNTDAAIPGGEFVKSNGKFQGICIDNAADLVKSQLPKAPFSAWEKGLATGLKNCHAQGLTQIAEAGISQDDITLIKDLQKQGKLDLRIYGMLSLSDENLGYISRNGMIYTDLFTMRSVKMYLDGALGSRGALLKGDYCDQLGHKGLQIIDEAKFEMYQVYLLNKGFQVCVHAIGDSANAIALRTFQKNIPEGYDARWRIEHAQIVNAKDQKIFAKRSIIPSVQPTHATSDAPWADERLCSTVAKGGYAYQNLLSQAKVIALGTDFPVEGISPINTFYAATQRMDAAGKLERPFIGEQALSRKQAMWGMTLWAAYANFDETRTGSLEAGKMADFIVMDTDLMTVAAEKIPKAKVWHTYIGGKSVYHR